MTADASFGDQPTRTLQDRLEEVRCTLSRIHDTMGGIDRCFEGPAPSALDEKTEPAPGIDAQVSELEKLAASLEGRLNQHRQRLG